MARRTRREFLKVSALAGVGFWAAGGVVSTPGHTHAVASIMAMRMGKHCYCEKPLTHSVHEARLMREVAAKHRVATQMGNHGTADSRLRTGVEVIRAGTLGDVREIH